MKITKGKVALNNDDVVVETAEGNKIPINHTSLGSKSYNIGEDIEGVIVDNTFNVCHEYDHNRKGKIFGFISQDDTKDEWITITVMEHFRPKFITENSQRRYQNEYAVGENITVRRSLITNY